VKTYSAKPSEIKKNWWITDGKDIVLGRKKLIKNMENSVIDILVFRVESKQLLARFYWVNILKEF